ncbi:MAG: hypothetical protein CMJ67_05160 [Planctomycetaceae bacterium]|nr:hypothetical protein [Planctomycetaceae bacterium]
MNKRFPIGWLCPLLLLPAFGAIGAEPPEPHWIWSEAEAADAQDAVFEIGIDVPQGATRLTIHATADNHLAVDVDGVRAFENGEWSQATWFEKAKPAPGRRVLRFTCRNDGGPAGLVAVVTVEHPDGDRVVVTDESWKVLDDDGAPRARPPADFGPASKPNGPWPDPFAEGKATPVDQISVPEGFEIELLHAARPGEGSWSAMTVDPKGRVVLSAQRGPLLRITPSDSKGGRARVERLHDTVGRAQGLLVVGNDLYANVADNPAKTGGLWRLRDADGDDQYEITEQLSAYGSGSEHGPHGIVLGPDGMIWMINGNYATIPEPLVDPSPHAGWAEDIVIERLWDPRGHAVGKMSPGGVLLRTDLDATEWEIMAAGMRNPYDIDFNRDGELFTYDADMEWDIGLPWYRTPRLIHLVSGGEYGWRGGSAKWPIDAADAFPAVLEMDAGSPTGVASGHRSNFPPPWNDSLFLGDWAYGRVLAVELEPDGATYTGITRPFLQGKPFNVTDFAFAPDGSMILTTGGRGSQSGLYRVKWTGDPVKNVAPKVDRVAEAARARRRAMEASHLDPRFELADLIAGLEDEDPAVRRAARIGYEHQLRANLGEGLDDEISQTSLLTDLIEESGGPSAWEGMLAIVRAGDRAEVLERLPLIRDLAEYDDSPEGRRYLARTLSLIIARHGPLEPGARETVLEILDEVYPTGRFDADRVLVEVGVALDAPFVVERTARIISEGTTPIETIHFLHALRHQGSGWDETSKSTVVSALDAMSQEQGGASFPGYVSGIRDGLLVHLGPDAADQLTELAEARETKKSESQARRFVRTWTVDEFEPHLSRVHAGRDFERGRALYTELQCAACHQVAGEGIAYGPDLTGVGARFSPLDLLVASVDPTRDLSDQYAGVLIRTEDDSMELGIPIERTDDFLALAPDPRSGRLRVEIPTAQIVSESAASPMPAGLLDTASMDEILDLLAYLRSAGNSNDPAFQRPP